MSDPLLLPSQAHRSPMFGCTTSAARTSLALIVSAAINLASCGPGATGFTTAPDLLLPTPPPDLIGDDHPLSPPKSMDVYREARVLASNPDRPASRPGLPDATVPLPSEKIIFYGPNVSESDTDPLPDGNSLADGFNGARRRSIGTSHPGFNPSSSNADPAQDEFFKFRSNFPTPDRRTLTGPGSDWLITSRSHESAKKPDRVSALPSTQFSGATRVDREEQFGKTDKNARTIPSGSTRNFSTPFSDPDGLAINHREAPSSVVGEMPFLSHSFFSPHPNLSKPEIPSAIRPHQMTNNRTTIENSSNSLWSRQRTRDESWVPDAQSFSGTSGFEPQFAIGSQEKPISGVQLHGGTNTTGKPDVKTIPDSVKLPATGNFTIPTNSLLITIRSARLYDQLWTSDSDNVLPGANTDSERKVRNSLIYPEISHDFTTNPFGPFEISISPENADPTSLLNVQRFLVPIPADRNLKQAARLISMCPECSPWQEIGFSFNREVNSTGEDVSGAVRKLIQVHHSIVLHHLRPSRSGTSKIKGLSESTVLAPGYQIPDLIWQLLIAPEKTSDASARTSSTFSSGSISSPSDRIPQSPPLPHWLGGADVLNRLFFNTDDLLSRRNSFPFPTDVKDRVFSGFSSGELRLWQLARQNRAFTANYRSAAGSDHMIRSHDLSLGSELFLSGSGVNVGLALSLAHEVAASTNAGVVQELSSDSVQIINYWKWVGKNLFVDGHLSMAEGIHHIRLPFPEIGREFQGRYHSNAIGANLRFGSHLGDDVLQFRSYFGLASVAIVQDPYTVRSQARSLEFDEQYWQDSRWVIGSQLGIHLGSAKQARLPGQLSLDLSVEAQVSISLENGVRETSYGFENAGWRTDLAPHSPYIATLSPALNLRLGESAFLRGTARMTWMSEEFSVQGESYFQYSF